MHCLLLGGMLGEGDTVAPSSADPRETCLTVNDDNRCLSWTFRICIHYCLYQILFSVWENRTTDKSFRHHVSYLYHGVQNFYLTWVFYLLHCANGASLLMNFEAFNFFYASHLPFFRLNPEANATNPHSLSSMVIRGQQESRPMNFLESPDFTKDRIKEEFEAVKQGVLNFWREHFRPLSDFIHGKGFAESGTYAAFFCNPVHAQRFVVDGKTKDHARHLGVSTFSHFFSTGPGYWFHFRQITMNQIETDCRLYFESQRNALVKRMWAAWYRHLCARIAQLGLPVALASHFQLGDGPSMHLSALLRAAGPRWRVAPCGRTECRLYNL